MVESYKGRVYQYSVPVNIIVKADSSEEAKSYVQKRMNAWLMEDHGTFIPGYGFPNGSLLFYAVMKKEELGAVLSVPFDTADEENAVRSADQDEVFHISERTHSG